MGKGIIFITIALLLDGLQAALDWAFLAAGSALTAATPIGAGIAGFGAGYAASSNAASGVVNGTIAGVATAVASPFGVPIGIALGFAVNFCISATLGVGLIFLLFLFGVAKPSDWPTIGGAGLFEMIPGLDALPGWTLMTVRCVIKSKAREGALAGSAAGAFGTILASSTPAGRMFGAISAVNQSTGTMGRNANVFTYSEADQEYAKKETQQRVSNDLKNIENMDGVKSAQKEAYA